MKRIRYAAALFLLFAMTEFAPSAAAPATSVAPSSASSRADIRSVCHHYRWSSQRRCTSANTLRYVARPPLFYPHQYFGGAPHYYYARPNYHWRVYPGYAHHRWYRWPYRYGWY
jgi:hypothetical protein